MLALTLILAIGPTTNLEPQTLCQLLARDLVLKPADPPVGRRWEGKTVRGLKALFGASSVSQMAVGTDNLVPEEIERLAGKCAPIANGGECHLEGPANFKLVTDGVERNYQLSKGEKAEVRIVVDRIPARISSR